MFLSLRVWRKNGKSFLHRASSLVRLVGCDPLCLRFPSSLFVLLLRQSSCSLFSFAHQICLESCELHVDLLFSFPLADNLLAITAQEIIYRFDTNPNGAGGLVFIEVFEAEIWRIGLLDDAFDDPVN